MLQREEEFRDKAVLDAAREVLLAVRTAPKSRGIDKTVLLLADGAEKAALAARMEAIDKASGGKRPTFTRDAKGVTAASGVLLIGVRIDPYQLNCSWCGFPTCAEKNAQPGVPCVFACMDLGIASGVAAARLADKFIDNRMMFSVGYAAINLGWFDPDVRLALGFPLSVSGKNPLFDRK